MDITRIINGAAVVKRHEEELPIFEHAVRLGVDEGEPRVASVAAAVQGTLQALRLALSSRPVPQGATWAEVRTNLARTCPAAD